MLLPTVSLITSTITPVKTNLSKPKKKQEWSRARPFEKLAEAYAGIARMGGKVFTLRLRKDVHDTVMSSSDPTRSLARRIREQFKRRGLPVPFHAFCLEVTMDDRNELHLHGAIVLGSLPLHLVKDILRAAGGRIAGKAGSRQVQIKKFDFDRGGPVGWANYPSKALARTRRAIRHERVTYITSPLRRRSAAQWEQDRQQFHYGA